jgi:hypothetical protein
VAKKIDRPTKSRWGGFDYEVQYLPKGTILVEGEEAFGVTDHNAQVIRVEEGMKPEREVSLLIHEPLHQMIGSASMKFHGTTDEVEEQVCTFVGDAIAGHIRDNPDFWRYLVKRLAPRKKRKPNEPSENSV